MSSDYPARHVVYRHRKPINHEIIDGIRAVNGHIFVPVEREDEFLRLPSIARAIADGQIIQPECPSRSAPPPVPTAGPVEPRTDAVAPGPVVSGLLEPVGTVDFEEAYEIARREYHTRKADLRALCDAREDWQTPDGLRIPLAELRAALEAPTE